MPSAHSTRSAAVSGAAAVAGAVLGAALDSVAGTVLGSVLVAGDALLLPQPESATATSAAERQSDDFHDECTVDLFHMKRPPRIAGGSMDCQQSP